MSNKCRKCGNDMPEDRKGYEQVCPSCKPLLLHNVIGGLEKKKVIDPRDWKAMDYNDLLSREVEVNIEAVNKILSLIEITKDGDGYHKLDEYWIRFDGKELGGQENPDGLATAISNSKAIEQGKVLKVIE